MEDRGKDISPKTAAMVALVLTLIGMGLAILGTYALIQAWVWSFPLVLVMLLGAVAFLISWVILPLYLFACIAELRGINPDAKHKVD